MSFTAFGSSDNLPSSWPAGVRYDHNSSRYVYSVSNAYQIAALQHVHVVDIDVPQVLSVPNVMSLTLPVMKNLPLESRLYFFYVTQATKDDQLSFLPVSLSGNTINGNAVSYTFVLTGEQELFIAIGVNDNYIIHAFGKNNPSLDLINHLPTEYWEFHGEVAPIFGPSFEYQAMPSASSDMYNGVAAPLGPTTVITGMEGFITADVPVPTQVFNGFLCNESGLYLVDPQLEARLGYTAVDGVGTNLGPYYANFSEFNADGSFNKHATAPAFVPFESNIAPTPPPPSSASLRGVNFETDADSTALVALAPFGSPTGYLLWPTQPFYPAPTAIGDNSLIASITPNKLVGGTYYGFQCNVAGFWSVNYHSMFASTWADGKLEASTLMVLDSTASTVKFIFRCGVSQAGAKVPDIPGPIGDTVMLPLDAGDIIMLAGEFQAGGGYAFVSGSYLDANVTFLRIGDYPIAPPAPLAPLAPAESTIDWRYNTSFLFALEAGKYYVPSFSWDDSSGGTKGEAVIIGGIAFVYWAPFELPPAPPGPFGPFSALRSAPEPLAKSLISSVNAANKNPDIFSSLSKSLAGSNAIAIQRSRSQAKPVGSRRGDLPSPSTTQPMFTLNDMERMINQALDSRDSRASAVAYY
jgi:hypothetical protein